MANLLAKLPERNLFEVSRSVPLGTVHDPLLSSVDPDTTSQVVLLPAAPSGSWAVNCVPRPFAVTYARNLHPALMYAENRASELYTEYDIWPSPETIRGGRISTAGCIFAGSGGSGRVFKETVDRIAEAVVLFLGPEMKMVSFSDPRASALFAGSTLAASTRQASVPSSSVLLQLEAIDPSTVVEAEDLDAARKALNEAKLFVRRHALDQATRVGISDDGAVTIAWERENAGLLLVFVGDGLVTIGQRSGAQLYAHNYSVLPLHDMPAHLLGSISDLA
jgi:hypothetical protein